MILHRYEVRAINHFEHTIYFSLIHKDILSAIKYVHDTYGYSVQMIDKKEQVRADSQIGVINEDIRRYYNEERDF